MEKVNILAVDDNKLILRLLEIILINEYNVFTTTNILTAINRLQKQKLPDLIITDLKMPEMDGIEFITYLNHSTEYRKIPILIISGYSKDEIIEKCQNLEIKGFVTKPLDPVELGDKIHHIFRVEA